MRKIISESLFCQSKKNCHTCRNNKEIREKIKLYYLVDEYGNGCPEKLPWDSYVLIKNECEHVAVNTNWCKRFLIPTNLEACKECRKILDQKEDYNNKKITVLGKTQNYEMPFKTWFIVWAMEWGKRLSCNRRYKENQEVAKCCGDKEKEMPVYYCKRTKKKCTVCIMKKILGYQKHAKTFMDK